MIITLTPTRRVMLKECDKFALRHMLGLQPQGYGQVRVRNIIAAVMYIRLAFDLSLRDAREVVGEYEEVTPRV